MNENKPLKYEEQVEYLKSKFLKIDDEDKVKKYLLTIGYARFKSYFKLFCNNNGKFKNNFSFDDLLVIYIFDRKLRNLFLDALERIEITIKNSIVDTISIKYDNPYFIYNEKLFNNNYNEVFKKIRENIWYQSNKTINLDKDKIPCWLISQDLTFGCLCALYGELNGLDRQEIADKFYLKNKVMLSWLLSVSASRNICAHYSVLWNRLFGIKPMNIKFNKNIILDFDKSNDKFYSQFYVISYFMLLISPNTSWISKVIDLIDDYSSKTTFIDYKIMGFPKDITTAYTIKENINNLIDILKK